MPCLQPLYNNIISLVYASVMVFSRKHPTPPSATMEEIGVVRSVFSPLPLRKTDIFWSDPILLPTGTYFLNSKY